ncbi:MAG: hypothetical protein ABI307_10295 [Mycobacterium sp.]
MAGIGAIAGVVGGVVGALLVGIGAHSCGSAPAASSTESTHVQDVTLCTTYALVKANLRHPIENGMDVLPAIAPLRLGLIENPDASPQIRDAISEAVAGFDAILARDAKPQGLSEPPAYDQATVNAALDRVRQACGLGE